MGTRLTSMEEQITREDANYIYLSLIPAEEKCWGFPGYHPWATACCISHALRRVMTPKPWVPALLSGTSSYLNVQTSNHDSSASWWGPSSLLWLISLTALDFPAMLKGWLFSCPQNVAFLFHIWAHAVPCACNAFLPFIWLRSDDMSSRKKDLSLSQIGLDLLSLWDSLSFI